eukprot:COSAG01_NODE_40493_length_463_cov_0.436813_1_plen_81_part_01
MQLSPHSADGLCELCLLLLKHKRTRTECEKTRTERNGQGIAEQAAAQRVKHADPRPTVGGARARPERRQKPLSKCDICQYN